MDKAYCVTLKRVCGISVIPTFLGDALYTLKGQQYVEEIPAQAHTSAGDEHVETGEETMVGEWREK